MEQSKICAQEEERRREKRREERVFSRTNITKQNSTNYKLRWDPTRLSKVPTPKEREKKKKK